MAEAAMDAHIQVVRFRAGRHEMVAEATQIAAMRTAPEPGCRRIEDVLGLPEPPAGPSRWLMVRGDKAGHADWCVEVSEPVRLASLPAAAIHSLPPLAAARQSLRGVLAVVVEENGAALVIDLMAARAEGEADLKDAPHPTFPDQASATSDCL